MTKHSPGWKMIRERSEGCCEAMVNVRGIYARCWQGPVEVHHLLTRARGGNLLDEVGETYHLIALCPGCHRRSDGGDAYMNGLLIDGYVNRDGNRIYYTGSDSYLSQRYPKDAPAFLRTHHKHWNAPDLNPYSRRYTNVLPS